MTMVRASQQGFQLQIGWLDTLTVSVVMYPQQSVLALLRQVTAGQSGGRPTWPSPEVGRTLRPAARFAARSFGAHAPTVIPECCAPMSPLADVPVAKQADSLRDLSPDVLTSQLHAGHGGRPYPRHWRAAGEQPRRWLASMADASLDAWAALQPRWRAAAPLLDREVQRVGTAVVRGGMDALLNSLHPRITYADGVLTFAYPNDQRVTLGDRPLALLPMIANRDAVGVSAERPEICYIAYPIRTPAPLPQNGASQALTLILGPLRAAALEALGRPLTVGELAVAVQCAPTTITYHLHQLAKAGLITRQRRGTSVCVTRTLRGNELVDLLSG
jgi:DNA-binding transcriptional ArsR family regulator